MWSCLAVPVFIRKLMHPRMTQQALSPAALICSRSQYVKLNWSQWNHFQWLFYYGQHWPSPVSSEGIRSSPSYSQKPASASLRVSPAQAVRPFLGPARRHQRVPCAVLPGAQQSCIFREKHWRRMSEFSGNWGKSWYSDHFAIKVLKYRFGSTHVAAYLLILFRPHLEFPDQRSMNDSWYKLNHK